LFIRLQNKKKEKNAVANWDKKYFITELKQVDHGAPWSPKFNEKEATRLLCLDDEVIKGAFYMETAWFWPGGWPASKGEEGTGKAHVHKYDEVVAFVGTNPVNPYDLGGEVELWVDDKQNILDRSFIAFIPAGTMHCPLKILRVDKPIFHFTLGLGKQYY
jgi:hypothetical protein